jgi:hypothetical protein
MVTATLLTRPLPEVLTALRESCIQAGITATTPDLTDDDERSYLLERADCEEN